MTDTKYRTYQWYSRSSWPGAKKHATGKRNSFRKASDKANLTPVIRFAAHRFLLGGHP